MCYYFTTCMTVNISNLLYLFFQNPVAKFYIRQLSRELGINTKTVMKYLNDYARQGIIRKVKRKKHYPYYQANKLSRIYRFEKSQFMIRKIIYGGLVEYLEKKTKAKAIILFGSG